MSSASGRRAGRSDRSKNDALSIYEFRDFLVGSQEVTGYERDSVKPFAWRYRDYVIAALNDDTPYDRFLTEQLAGDLLPNPTLNQRIATGFGRNHVINSEGGIIEEEYRVGYVADRVRTLGMAWLGLTLDPPANARHGPRISGPDSGVTAWVIATDEEQMIARHTHAML